jgi:hypothetical protein
MVGPGALGALVAQNGQKGHGLHGSQVGNGASAAGPKLAEAAASTINSKKRFICFSLSL